MTPLELRLCGYGALALLLLSTATGCYAYVSHMESQHKADVALHLADQATHVHDVAQAALTTSAGQVASAGQAHVAADLTIHTENSNAITSAPGAAALADPAFSVVVTRSLCRYAAYAADPGCAAVRGSDTPVLPSAH